VSVRLLAIVAELVLSGVVICWGVATVRYPALWRLRSARWWVGWTPEPVGRAEGVGVALAGVGTALVGVAAAMISSTAPVTPHERGLKLIGLGLLVLAVILLALVHPTVTEEADEDLRVADAVPTTDLEPVPDPVAGPTAVPV
jgi:hypothetical protein